MWSPDGRYLAYRRTDCPGESSSTRGNVVISDAAGNVLAAFPAAGWGIGWSPDSSRVAVWDSLFETVGVYGLDGARHARIAMPSRWQPSGDQDPAWLQNGTLALDAVELPLDGSPAKRLDAARAEEWRRENSFVQHGMRANSPDGSNSAFAGGRSLEVEKSAGSGLVKLVTVERGMFVSVWGFSPEGDRILFSKTDHEDESSLWSIGVDGSDARLLVAGTRQGDWLTR